MITRRDFIRTAAVTTAASPLAAPRDAQAAPPRQPLRAAPRRTTLFVRPLDDMRLRLFSDASPTPRPLIRDAALDRAFGRGAGRLLAQPDHWRMIEEGWFSGDDLYTPDDPELEDYWIWQANHHPECQAHDLLYDLFRSELRGPFGSMSGLGLALGEHPCSPRFATATLNHEGYIDRLVARVAELTDWIAIDPEPRAA